MPNRCMNELKARWFDANKDGLLAQPQWFRQFQQGAHRANELKEPLTTR